MTFEKAFVAKKLEEIAGYLEEVRDLFQDSDTEILGNSTKLHSAERLLQLVVDTMLDVNQHFIREKGLKGLEDFQGTFYVLGQNGILPADFAQRLAPVVGLRNRIVHRYEALDKKLFITTFRRNYPDFERYARHITQYLDSID